MNIAHILPIKTIRQKPPQRPVEMYLAHLVLKYPELFRSVPDVLPGNIRIMDNGNYELHRSCSVAELKEACEIIRPTEIVVPDVLWEAKATIKSTAEALTKVNDWPVKRMAVAQGRSFDEVLNCARALINLPGVDVLGLPKYLSYEWFPGNRWSSQGRPVAAEKLLYDNPRLEIHFLGCAGGIEELMHPGVHRVRSMDTSLWMLYARLGWDIGSSRPADLEADLEEDDLPLEAALKYMADVDEWQKWRSIIYG